MCNPSSGDLVEGVPADISRTLRRRYFLVEKARNANIIGKPPEAPPCLHTQDSLSYARLLSELVILAHGRQGCWLLLTTKGQVHK